jgi:hypothetical protein
MRRGEGRIKHSSNEAFLLVISSWLLLIGKLPIFLFYILLSLLDLLIDKTPRTMSFDGFY